MNALTTLLGTRLPLIQAPMAGVQGSALAIAVTQAGALGSLPAAMLSADALRDELQRITTQISGAYNVNFFCHTPPATPSPEQDQAWQQDLQPFYDELGVPLDATSPGAGRTPFNADLAEVLAELRPPVVSFHFGLPAPDLLNRVRSWGAKVISSATTVSEAIWLEQQGVDAIIAQGLEAGGHRGMFLTQDLSTQMGTFALLPHIVQAVRVPVIAAGGIANAAGVRAAMALGAAGVQVGTAYLRCPECSTSGLHRAALVSEAARHTALTNVFTGRPARGIVNRLMRELGGSATRHGALMCPSAPAFPLATAAITPLRAAAEKQGNSDFSPLWAGQNASGCQDWPAAQVTKALAAGFNSGD
ncbi:MAG: hypothetical protein RJA34_1159 [Pseudomonadota bacterium]|jgi:nitronate monooxygenase